MVHRKLNISKWGLTVCVLVFIAGASGQLQSAVLRADKFDTAGKTLEKATILPAVPYKRISLDGYTVDRGVVTTGQTLPTILKPYGVTNASIFRVCKMAKGIFNVRQIKTGRPYSVVRDSEQRLEVRYFIYEDTPEDFVVFELGKSPDVFMEQKTLEKETKQISGMVKSTLWGALKAQGARTDLILKFEEVFGLKVNLSKLILKDSFDVIFEEYSDGDQFVRTGTILSARLTSGGKQLTAYQYNHHGITGYYDKEGNNFNTAFLRSPLQYKKVTSAFSLARKYPITNKIKRHPAIDYGAPVGTPVMSVGDGIVEDAGYSRQQQVIISKSIMPTHLQANTCTCVPLPTG